MRKEAHIEHAIRFVDDDALQIRECDRADVEQFTNASWRADHDVDARLHCITLRRERDLAEHTHNAQQRTLHEFLNLFANLLREFARGNNDDRTQALRGIWSSSRGIGGLVAKQHIRDRNSICERLACACWREADRILSTSRNRNEHTLNIRGCGVAKLRNAAQHEWMEFKFIKPTQCGAARCRRSGFVERERASRGRFVRLHAPRVAVGGHRDFRPRHAAAEALENCGEGVACFAVWLAVPRRRAVDRFANYGSLNRLQNERRPLNEASSSPFPGFSRRCFVQRTRVFRLSASKMPLSVRSVLPLVQPRTVFTN